MPPHELQGKLQESATKDIETAARALFHPTFFFVVVSVVIIVLCVYVSVLRFGKKKKKDAGKTSMYAKAHKQQ